MYTFGTYFFKEMAYNIGLSLFNLPDIQVGTNTSKKFPTWREHHLCKSLCGLRPFQEGT